MRPEISEPLRKIRKCLTLIEVDMDDAEDPCPQSVEQQIQKIEEQLAELRRLNNA